MNRALLLTDVVDSTMLAEQLGDAAMAALWAKHDRVARDLLPVHRGREIDKTDGFLLLFETAADAAAYALAYHRAIGELGLKARAGLHVGPVLLTENAPADVALGAKPLEVDGLAKPVAARVMSVALGGQTLSTVPVGPRVESHGHWRMKGVSEPIELFEVGEGEAPFRPPPDGAKVYRVVWAGQHWLPARQVKHSLVAERDTFVGRGADLQALARLLDDGVRLVSVLGMGGTGKTRLVSHYGWTWLGDWPGGVWFCDLSEARGADGIVYAVARALDVPLGKDPVAQLGQAIARLGRCLVVLDNFEQVARHGAETLGRWLDRAADAAFVVTTREVLGLPGEHALPLAPLVAADGVDLFAARARQAKPDFVADDPAAIRALVKLLDGLPLAIELAAARVRLMPPKTLLQRMSERFKLLSSSGGRHARQATLRGALDWSWDLLSADEQAALAQLSVFEGGFTLEAAEGVLALSELWPMDAVQALLDKSLVRQVSDDRFDVLVSVQEYAAEKLEALDGRSDAEARHAAVFARLARQDTPGGLRGHGGAAQVRALGRELDNLVAACRRSAARGAGEPAVALMQAAWEVLAMTGPAAQAVDLAQRVAAVQGLSPHARVTASNLLGRALDQVGRTEEARAAFTTALAVAREPHTDGTRDRQSEAGVRLPLGLLDMRTGRLEEAGEHLEEALVLAREVGNRRMEGQGLLYLAMLYQRQGRLDEARQHYALAVGLARELGNRRLEGVSLGNVAILNFQQGRLDEAREQTEAALAVVREVGDRWSEGVGLGSLGAVLASQGRLDEARRCFDAALAVAREVGNPLSEGVALGHLGGLHRAQGRLEEACASFESALVVAREVENRHSEGHLLAALGDARLAQGRLDDARACLGDGERLVREIGDPRELAKLLCVRARLEARSGDLAAARAVFGEVTELAARVGAPPASELGQALAEARAAVEAP